MDPWGSIGRWRWCRTRSRVASSAKGRAAGHLPYRSGGASCPPRQTPRRSRANETPHDYLGQRPTGWAGQPRHFLLAGSSPRLASRRVCLIARGQQHAAEILERLSGTPHGVGAPSELSRHEGEIAQKAGGEERRLIDSPPRIASVSAAMRARTRSTCASVISERDRGPGRSTRKRSRSAVSSGELKVRSDTV